MGTGFSRSTDHSICGSKTICFVREYRLQTVHEIRAGRVSRLAHMPGPNGRTARPDIEDDEGDSYDGLT